MRTREPYSTAWRRKVLARRETKWATLDPKPSCNRCGKPCMRRAWIQGNIQCSTCYNRRPNVKKAHVKDTRKVFRFGGRKLRAKTPAQAELIRAHIKRRKHEFVAGQSARAQAESDSAVPVRPETTA